MKKKKKKKKKRIIILMFAKDVEQLEPHLLLVGVQNGAARLKSVPNVALLGVHSTDF